MGDTTGMADSVTAIDFFFDPMCPWAYQTSLWIREVRRLNGLEIRWRFFSLEEINRPEGKKHPWERELAYGWSPMRVGAHLRRTDPTLCDAWYLACGQALHEHGRKPHDPDTARSLLVDIGARPEDWDGALADPTTHDDVRNDHEFAVRELGGFGVPILLVPARGATPTKAVFGPVVVPAPMGDQAIALWDLTLAYTRIDGLYEIKTPKLPSDLQAIGRFFTPYLQGRDWQSVQNPAP
jgi:2-hydroxychromene-2-carboxylate isomerase